MPSKQPLVDPRYTGLTESPVVPVIKTTEKSKVLITGVYDMFVVDLKTCTVKKLTDGEKDMIRYRLAVNSPTKGFGFRTEQRIIKLKDNNLLQLFGERNFYSGFAYLHNEEISQVIYGDYNFFNVLTGENFTFAVSKKYQKPLEIYDLKFHKADKRFIDVDTLSTYDPSLKMDLLHYSYKSKKSNIVLLYPKDYDPTKKYPMIVNVYENTAKYILDNKVPDLYASDGFNYMHYVSQGYFVLLPELQYEFQNVPARFIGSLEAAVHKALKNKSIDKNRLAIVGLSFGGYESGLAMGMSKLFRTASIGVMISEMISYSLSYTNMFKNPNYIRAETQQHALSSSPFENWRLYNKYSPLYYLKNVSRPILIWGGAKDKNVPPSQALIFFLGLKRLSKPAILLDYSEEQHQIVNPANQQDLSVKTWQWMEYFLKYKPPADWIKPILKKAPF
jgi:dipeptidyl aminopeptidase/acylaminoacyl peptidase